MKKILLSVLLLGGAMSCMAQILNSKVIDNGGSGPYKAIAATESTLQNHVVYRPDDIDVASKKEGKLPVLVFANGGCSDTSITHERVLSDMASYGYIIIANGALQQVITDRKHGSAPNSMLSEAIDWIVKQNNDPNSEYYGLVDIERIAAGGQSCGGAQVLYAAPDSRIKSCMMFNSGMGNITMAEVSKESLKKLHCPIIYIIGGESDVAYANAVVDYENITDVPVAFADLTEGGHMGTFGEEFGGSFSRMAVDWLDWQFKGKKSNSKIFLKSKLSDFQGWTMKAKNF